MLALNLCMRMQFKIPLSSLRPQALRSLRAGSRGKYHNFTTYCVHGLPNTAPDGFKIPFSDGHTHRLGRLTSGPYRYRPYADCYLDVAMPMSTCQSSRR